MSRASRLAEIAKANQPAFSSESGNHWWLADASPKPEPESAAPAEVPVPVAASATLSEPTPAAVADSRANHAPHSSAEHFAASLQVSSEPSPTLQSSGDSVYADPLPVAAFSYSPTPALNGAAEPARNGIEIAIQLDAPPSALPQRDLPPPVLSRPVPPQHEPAQSQAGPVSRFAALKERFIRLGRKNRGEDA